jgi:hypothetical protein
MTLPMSIQTTFLGRLQQMSQEFMRILLPSWLQCTCNSWSDVRSYSTAYTIETDRVILPLILPTSFVGDMELSTVLSGTLSNACLTCCSSAHKTQKS